MTAATGRYDRLGPVYDVVSLERVLYRRPRARLAELLGPMPGATVVDVGCGTGLNLAWLRRAVGPGGRVIGLDPSRSMLAAARRRTRRHGWTDVTVIDGDVDRLADVLDDRAIVPDGLVATFVLSVVPCDDGFWAVVDALASTRPIRVGLAELGAAHDASPWRGRALDALTALGGGAPDRRPWERLVGRDVGAVHEVHLGGHVHLAAGSPAPGAGG